MPQQGQTATAHLAERPAATHGHGRRVVRARSLRERLAARAAAARRWLPRTLQPGKLLVGPQWRRAAGLDAACWQLVLVGVPTHLTRYLCGRVTGRGEKRQTLQQVAMEQRAGIVTG